MDYEKIIEDIKEGSRYEDFTFTATPTPFYILFKDENIEYVQEHITCEQGVNYWATFSGVFSWIDGEVSPPDGDVYYKDMNVIGWNYFEADGNKCLDVVVCEL